MSGNPFLRGRRARAGNRLDPDALFAGAKISDPGETVKKIAPVEPGKPASGEPKAAWYEGCLTMLAAIVVWCVGGGVVAFSLIYVKDWVLSRASARDKPQVVYDWSTRPWFRALGDSPTDRSTYAVKLCRSLHGRQPLLDPTADDRFCCTLDVGGACDLPRREP